MLDKSGLYQYLSNVVNVVDADTLDVTVDLGFYLYHRIRLRVKGYDAPETWRPRNEAEKIHGERATKRATELLAGQQIRIAVSKCAGIYYRYETSITLPDGRDFATIMIAEGFQKLESY